MRTLLWIVVVLIALILGYGIREAWREFRRVCSQLEDERQ
jgi:hypothetical protein